MALFFQQFMDEIQNNWMDESIVASSYANYINSKISIMNNIRNQITEFLAQLDTPSDINSEEIVRQHIVDLLASGEKDSVEIRDWMNARGFNQLNEYFGMPIPCEDGDLTTVFDICQAYASSIKTNMDPVIETLNQKSKSLVTIMNNLNQGIDQNFAIIEALNAFASNLDASNFLSNLQANLGDRFQGVSPFASKAFELLNDKAYKVQEKVRALISPITDLDIDSVSGSMLNTSVNNAMFTGQSPATFWLDTTVNLASKLASVYVASIKISWQITVGIFKLVGQIGAAIWNRFLRGLFVTDDILINDEYNCEYINIPRCQYKMHLFGNENISYYDYQGKISDLNTEFFGSVVTNNQIRDALFRDGYAIDFPFKFGLIRLIQDDADPDTIIRQIYVTPTTPIDNQNRILDWMDFDAGFAVTRMARSISDQFKYLFSEATTNEINVEKNDRFYWKAFQVSIARLDFFIGVMANARFRNDSLFWTETLTSSNSTSEWKSDAARYWLLFGAKIESGDGPIIYISPSSSFNLLNVSMVNVAKGRIDTDPSGDPSNADFLWLISGGTVNVTDSTNSWLFGNLSYVSTAMLCLMVFQTTTAGMNALALAGRDINGAMFIPYRRSNDANFVFKYTLASDAYNRQAFSNQIKLTTTAVLVVAASIFIFKGMKTLQTKAIGDVNTTNALLWQKVTDPESVDKTVEELQSDLYRATRRYNRISSLTGGLSADVTSGLTIGNSENIADVIKIIRG